MLISNTVLAALITTACAKFEDKEDKIACIENIVNCAVGPGGQIKQDKAFECAEQKANKDLPKED